MSKVEFKSAAAALSDLEKRGFSDTFEPDGAGLKSRASGRTFRANEMMIIEVHRFEGITDPEDMSVVYAVQAEDGTKGTLTDAFGPYSNPELGDALRNMKTYEPRAEASLHQSPQVQCSTPRE